MHDDDQHGSDVAAMEPSPSPSGLTAAAGSGCRDDAADAEELVGGGVGAPRRWWPES